MTKVYFTGTTESERRNSLQKSSVETNAKKTRAWMNLFYYDLWMKAVNVATIHGRDLHRLV